MQSWRFSELWGNRDFLKLWAGQSVSQLGSEVSILAIPLVAALTLEASAFQMGMLAASSQVAWLLVALFAGAWVDRMKRRPILIAADIGRAVLLASIPVAALLGVLSMGQLFIVAFLTGVLSVFFEVSYQSYLPSLVQREHLIEANGKLQISRSVADMAGPSGAGILVGVLTAPITVAIDAVSFLGSAFFLRLIKREEPQPVPHEERKNLWKEIGEGMRVLVDDPVLRTIAGTGTVITLFFSVIDALFVLYAVRELELSPVTLGFVLAAAAPGALLGATLASWAARLSSPGRTVIFAYLLDGISYLLIPLGGALAAPKGVIVVMLAVSWFMAGLGSVIYQVNAISLFQTITPDRLLGRVNATRRFFVQGSIPVGAILGGIMGSAFGLSTTLTLAALGSLLAFLWALFSPLRTLPEQPEPVE